MIARLRWIASGAVLLLILGGGVYSCQHYNAGVVTQQVQQADTNHQQAQTHETQAVTHDAKAETIAPELAALRAEVERLRRIAAPALAVGAPANPLVPVVAAQDRVIQSQDAHAAELTAARDEHKAAEQAYKAEAGNLRTALAHTPQPRPLAVGVLYGTDKTIGAWVEYDFGPVRVGADVVRRPYAGGGTTLEGIARVGWRFR